MRLWLRYLALGWRLRRLAADRRSRWLLPYLGATTLARSSRRAFDRPIAVRIRFQTTTYEVRLKTRTELDVLQEIGIEDEYRPADRIQAETIVDLGASVGLATLRLLASHPGARAIAVEADPELIPRLRANVAGLPVTVVHAAIGSDSGERTFYRSDMDSWASSLDRTLPSQTPVLVPALSLDELLDREGLERIDLLKLDVEGAEWEILEEGLGPGIAAVVGEVHERGAGTPDIFIDRLAESMRVETISAEPGRATFLATREPR
jgi:FkbM family methyltransferase